MQQAVKLVDTLVRKRSFKLEPVLEQAKRLIDDSDVGPTTRAILSAAEKRDIPNRRDGTHNRFQLGYGKHLRYVQAAMTDQTSAVGVELAQNKDETKDRLERNGIPVPKGRVVYTLKEANKAAELPPVQKALQELSAEPVIALQPLKQMPSLKRPARIHSDRPRRFGKRLVPAMPSL